MGLLDRLRGTSREAKARYAFIGASVITGVIALVWLSTLPSRFAEVGSVSVGEREETEDLRELWGETTEQLGEVIRSTGELDNLNALQEEPLEVSEASSEGPAQDPIPTEVSEESEAAPEPEGNEEPETPRIILIGTTTAGSGE